MAQDTTVTPYEAYSLMVQDYRDTQAGLLPPTESAEFDHRAMDKNQQLHELGGNLVYFAMHDVDIPPEQILHDTGMSAETLIEDLERDERLIEQTAAIRERLRGPKVAGMEQRLTEPLSTKTLKWLPSSVEGLQLQTESIESEGLEYDFVDLAPLHRVTAKAEAGVKKEGNLDEALSYIKKVGIPRLERAVRSGNGGAEFRPVQDIGTNNRDRGVKSDYPAYKLGVNGTEHRAIILLMGNKSERKIYGLAALYNHTDQDAVLHALSQDHTKRRA